MAQHLQVALLVQMRQHQIGGVGWDNAVRWLRNVDVGIGGVHVMRWFAADAAGAAVAAAAAGGAVAGVAGALMEALMVWMMVAVG